MKGGTIFVLVAAVLGSVAPALSAQEYDIFGTIETRASTAHRKDAPVVIDADERDTWYSSAEVRLAATHRLMFDQADLVVDHAILLQPSASGTASAGSGGTGASDATEVELTHDLYQGYLYLYPAPWLSASVGRQRLNWGKAFSFSVTDALHPQSPDSEVEPGFDGAAVTFLVGPNLSLELAGAVQEAIASGDNGDLRGAVYLSYYLPPFDLALSYVYQNETIYRPGILASIPAGPFLVAAEAAVELYEPREQTVEAQPLASIGAEYTLYGALNDLSVAAEYVYNGLAVNNPFVTDASRTLVTRDYGGGFERPGEHYLYGALTFTRLNSWSTTHAVIYNGSDESSYVEHEVNLQRIPAIDLGLAVLWNTGKLESEFGLLSDDFTVRLSAKASF